MCSPHFIYFSSDVDKIQYRRCPQKNITQLLVLVKSTNESQIYVGAINEFVISIVIDLFYVFAKRDLYDMNFLSDVWLTVHRNSVWIRKTN